MIFPDPEERGWSMFQEKKKKTSRGTELPQIHVNSNPTKTQMMVAQSLLNRIDQNEKVKMKRSDDSKKDKTDTGGAADAPPTQKNKHRKLNKNRKTLERRQSDKTRRRQKQRKKEKQRKHEKKKKNDQTRNGPYGRAG